MGALRAGCWLVCRRQLLVAAYPGYELSTTATSCYDPPTHHEAVRGGRFGARLGVRVLQRRQHLVQLLALAVVQCAHLRFLAAGSTGQRAARGGLGNVVEVPSSAGNDWMGPKRLPLPPPLCSSHCLAKASSPQHPHPSNSRPMAARSPSKRALSAAMRAACSSASESSTSAWEEAASWYCLLAVATSSNSACWQEGEWQGGQGGQGREGRGQRVGAPGCRHYQQPLH